MMQWSRDRADSTTPASVRKMDLELRLRWKLESPDSSFATVPK